MMRPLASLHSVSRVSDIYFPAWFCTLVARGRERFLPVSSCTGEKQPATIVSPLGVCLGPHEAPCDPRSSAKCVFALILCKENAGDTSSSARGLKITACAPLVVCFTVTQYGWEHIGHRSGSAKSLRKTARLWLGLYVFMFAPRQLILGIVIVVGLRSFFNNGKRQVVVGAVFLMISLKFVLGCSSFTRRTDDSSIDRSFTDGSSIVGQLYFLACRYEMLCRIWTDVHSTDPI